MFSGICFVLTVLNPFAKHLYKNLNKDLKHSNLSNKWLHLFKCNEFLTKTVLLLNSIISIENKLNYMEVNECKNQNIDNNCKF